MKSIPLSLLVATAAAMDRARIALCMSNAPHPEYMAMMEASVKFKFAVEPLLDAAPPVAVEVPA